MTLPTACPKPKRKPKDPRPLRRSGKPRAVNPKRKKSEFARCYGSKERVQFVKSLPCVYCHMIHGAPLLGGGIHNAHTENGGRGRKGHYTTIIPLCPTHHRNYDDHQPPLVSAFIRGKLKANASKVEKLWLESLSAGAKRGTDA